MTLSKSLILLRTLIYSLYILGLVLPVNPSHINIIVLPSQNRMGIKLMSRICLIFNDII